MRIIHQCSIFTLVWMFGCTHVSVCFVFLLCVLITFTYDNISYLLTFYLSINLKTFKMNQLRKKIKLPMIEKIGVFFNKVFILLVIYMIFHHVQWKSDIGTAFGGRLCIDACRYQIHIVGMWCLCTLHAWKAGIHFPKFACIWISEYSSHNQDFFRYLVWSETRHIATHTLEYHLGHLLIEAVISASSTVAHPTHSFQYFKS